MKLLLVALFSINLFSAIQTNQDILNRFKAVSLRFCNQSISSACQLKACLDRGELIKKCEQNILDFNQRSASEVANLKEKYPSEMTRIDTVTEEVKQIYEEAQALNSELQKSYDKCISTDDTTCLDEYRIKSLQHMEKGQLKAKDLISAYKTLYTKECLNTREYCFYSEYLSVSKDQVDQIIQDLKEQI